MQVRNEVMRLKIVKENIPVVTIFPDLPDIAENNAFLNEFLAKEVLELLRLVRARAKARNYERGQKRADLRSKKLRFRHNINYI